MLAPLELQLIKSFIELSILINPDKQFLLPDWDKNNIYQKFLFKGISELKRDGVIDINLSINGGLVVKLKNVALS